MHFTGFNQFRTFLKRVPDKQKQHYYAYTASSKIQNFILVYYIHLEIAWLPEASFVQKLADFFAANYPDLKGFNRRGLYRMKQFYELYKDNEKVSPLVTQLNWTIHLKIMSACKSMEERIFYMNMCIKERLSKRELERQIDSGYYERYMLSQKPLTPELRMEVNT